jgi:hypothetical protein
MVNKTIAIPGDEANYVVELNVFHLLRCLVSNVIASVFQSVSSQEYRTSSDGLYTPITIIKVIYQMSLITTVTVSLAFGNP